MPPLTLRPRPNAHRSEPPVRDRVRRGAMAGAIVVGLTAGGCATATVRHAPPVPGPRPVTARVRGVREEAVERAVRRHGDVGVSSASCRAPARGARTPFGNTRRPVMRCLVGTDQGRAWYEVEVLRNGCFLAERDEGGAAIRGCGVNELHAIHET
jgi:hypothetical protein